MAKCQGTTVEPSQLAGWIGLENAGLLGAQPIRLPESTVERLRDFGVRAELTTGDVAAVLGVTTTTVRSYTCPERTIRREQGRAVVLGHRFAASGWIFISAADLAAFITQAATPPVSTTGAAPKVDVAEAQRAMGRARRKHNLSAA